MLDQYIWRKRPFSRRSGAQEVIPGALAQSDFEVLAQSVHIISAHLSLGATLSECCGE